MIFKAIGVLVVAVLIGVGVHWVLTHINFKRSNRKGK